MPKYLSFFWGVQKYLTPLRGANVTSTASKPLEKQRNLPAKK